MFCLVGNVPSSGSSLLSDLLDSTTYTASGPEIEFFCNKYLYDFAWFQNNFGKTSHLFNLRSTGIFPRYDRLDAYGLTKIKLKKMSTE